MMHIIKTLSSYGIRIGMGITYGVDNMVYITCDSKIPMGYTMDNIIYGISSEKLFRTRFGHIIVDGVDEL